MAFKKLQIIGHPSRRRWYTFYVKSKLLNDIRTIKNDFNCYHELCHYSKSFVAIANPLSMIDLVCTLSVDVIVISCTIELPRDPYRF